MKVILLGLPKCGTVSFTESLNKIGIKAVHYYADDNSIAAHHVLNAIKNGKSLYHYLSTGYGYEAVTQADIISPSQGLFFFPQVTLFKEIIDQYPESKFILNCRDTVNHVASIKSWGDMADRFRISGVNNIADFVNAHNTRIEAYCNGMDNFLKFNIENDSNDLLREFIHPDFNLVHVNKTKP